MAEEKIQAIADAMEKQQMVAKKVDERIKKEGNQIKVVKYWKEELGTTQDGLKLKHWKTFVIGCYLKMRTSQMKLHEKDLNLVTQ